MSSPDQLNQTRKPSYCLPADPQTGKGLKFILETNPNVPEQVEEFEAVATTNPSSIQEFLIRLNNLQKQKSKTKI